MQLNLGHEEAFSGLTPVTAATEEEDACVREDLVTQHVRASFVGSGFTLHSSKPLPSILVLNRTIPWQQCYSNSNKAIIRAVVAPSQASSSIPLQR